MSDIDQSGRRRVARPQAIVKTHRKCLLGIVQRDVPCINFREQHLDQPLLFGGAGTGHHIGVLDAEALFQQDDPHPSGTARLERNRKALCP